jgi:hypothetical protein
LEGKHPVLVIVNLILQGICRVITESECKENLLAGTYGGELS